MESTTSLSHMDEVKLQASATIDVADSEEPESTDKNSSDEEESGQLTIADVADEEDVTENIYTVKQEDTAENIGEGGENQTETLIAGDETIEKAKESAETTAPEPTKTALQIDAVKKEEEVEEKSQILNGNHSLPIDDGDNTCSSTTSSASSHNLVIDDPLGEKILSINTSEVVEHVGGFMFEAKSLKRKLSACENGSPQNKQIHLDTKSPDRKLDELHRDKDVREVQPASNILSPQESYVYSNSIANETPPPTMPQSPRLCEQYAACATSLEGETLNYTKPLSPYEQGPNEEQYAMECSLPITVPSLQPNELSNCTKVNSPSPYDQYVPSSNNGLPPPKLHFDCFKCKNAIFETFTQLRDHHKVCLFREYRRKLPQTPTITPTCRNEKSPDRSEQSSPPPPSPSSKKRFYLCSSCGTYHENWNLFLHIREIHNRHVCLYCIRLFPTAEKLSLHLEIKHDLEQNHFNSEERLRNVSKSEGNSRFLMCCTCQHVFSEHERFSDHICTEYMQPCSLCSQKGRHLNNCKGNPEKRPKVKKKTKSVAPATVTKANIQASITPPVCDQNKSIKNNNNNQMVFSTLPMLQPPIPHEFVKQNGFSEPTTTIAGPEEPHFHSDDSTNMVIDETCASNNYVGEMAGVNPFKALDDRERLLQEVHKGSETKTTLPPDIVPEAIPEPKPLIVPKIKLRVPKEFQKAVESEISSTDSDEDDEDADGDEEEEEDELKQDSEGPVENNLTASKEGDDSDNNDLYSADDKENTQDWDESNSSLDRILKEIEKTKLDIQRTKEMLEPMNNLKRLPAQDEVPAHVQTAPQFEAPLEVETPLYDELLQVKTPLIGVLPPAEETHQVEAPSPPQPASCSFINSEKTSIDSEAEGCMSSWSTPERGTYSPTPPTTPNSWASPLYISEVSPAVVKAVSERENIENMEKESEQAKEQISESDKMDISGDLDVESNHNLEESTMGIDETIKSREPSVDFNPIAVEEIKTPSPQTVTEDGFKSREEEDERIDVVNEKVPPDDGIDLANDDVLITDLLLDRPIEKFETVEFVRLCVKAVYSLCLYCNHARRIAVSGHSLVLHLLAQHRFAATVDSITAEELLPSTIVSKLKSFLPELEEHYFNLETYCSIPAKGNTITCDERQFECFQCRFSTKMHKDLYLHNRKMHLKTAILCFMCRSNFFSFSEILCHICPGVPNKMTVFDIKFRCCLCDVDGIPSPFRLMVHLRKKHLSCDVCLEDCREQARLSSHVWKHKLHHLCYRCGIAYRNKMDITKHLFWKHGTESIFCKRCLQKRWRHVYHFCVPPTSFVCESCNLCFSKATYLKVHKRVHSGDFRYPCTEDNCEEKFISRKLLLKHNAIHAPPEIKVEDNVECKADVKNEEEKQVKEEKTTTEENSLPTAVDSKDEPPPVEGKTSEKATEQASKRKKKKSRNKVSLEDLNLTAPNLSESDSSNDSDTEKLKTDEKDLLVPNVLLSPPSEDDKEDEKEFSKAIKEDTEKIMNIWENFKTFQASQQPKQDEDDTMSLAETNYPTPILHVICSDHDYCAMYKIRPRVALEVASEQELTQVSSDTERNMNDSAKSVSPTKKKRKSTGSGSSSSDSSSGSDSSCSCGSNCSCSTSGSSSNSSSSSDEDSDSSTSEGRRRIALKKEERANRNRWKNESSMKASLSESVDVVVEDKEPTPLPAVKENLDPVIIETDLETAESDTDEEFYDEHPQKLASEMLAQKRDQLRAQMRLSPSHNFDIIENSRPSTPSLPEEVVKEKKVKLKKKKRDRKSTNKSQAVPPIKLNLLVNKVEISARESVVHQTSMQVPEVDLEPPYNLIASPGVAEPPVAHQPVSAPILLNNTMQSVPFFHSRMSEGSSCSDADNSLKRSKRARRPNKFYGYTSDDENMQGTPLLIGTRTFKPQPPPQLTWRKEDLPAPSKSILLNKQPRSPRTTKTPAGSSGQVKKRVHQKSSNGKKKQHSKLPPIPTLKIRSKIGIVAPLVTPALLPPPPPANPNSSNYSSSRDDSDDTDSSDDDLEISAANTVPTWTPPVAPQAPVVVEPTPLPPPPPPQATVFNQKIPPALLPNPDFATIQYFKRNNIRYPIMPPAGARQPRDGESVYCYCRCPYDEVSEMIACDGENCLIEWFHFECVGIMVAPQGKWFCAECRPKYSNELYPQL